MINTDKTKEVRIKRANTDWWINEKAITAANGLTYIAYVTDMGEIHVKEFDAKCSRTPSRDVCIRRLNCSYADEHNAPSLCILNSGRIMVTYTGHAQIHSLSYRITEKPYDIMSFGKEHTLKYDSVGNVTYAQVFENTKRNEIWLFSRVRSVTWEFRYSKDEGESWSEPVTFLKSESGGLFYFDVRKQTVPAPEGEAEQWFFALYGHPRISKDHTIRSGIFDADGRLLRQDGSPTDISLFGEKSEIVLDELDTVYESPEGTTVRLLSVSATQPYRVGLAVFTLDNAESIVYYAAEYGDGWTLSEPIAKAGEFLAPGQTDGSQTYVGGMAFYYGVGEAGFNPADGGMIDTNRLYLSRTDNEYWYLESYVSRDCGKSYKLEQVIRKIPISAGVKIWRPTVPIFAQDNLPVYWHEGSYSAHTGGWHCDAVMLVEYDD